MRVVLLRITAQVRYNKTPWALVKNFIEKNVNSGMEENFELLGKFFLLQYFFLNSHHKIFINLLLTSM